MNDWERVYIDTLLHDACDIVCQTAIQRCDGPTNTLKKLREDPNGEGIWLDQFIPMFLGERAFDTDAGACAILEAFAKKPMPQVQGDSISSTLRGASRSIFAEMVLLKIDETLQRGSMQEGGVH